VGWRLTLEMQAKLAALSLDSSYRVVEGAMHESLLYVGATRR
jgi:hypothetical protein